VTAAAVEDVETRLGTVAVLPRKTSGAHAWNQLVIGLWDFTSESDSKRAREKKRKKRSTSFSFAGK
jgi:hypothetical protein